MKSIIPDFQTKNEIEIAIQKRQQQEYKQIGQYIPKIDGYTIYDVDRNCLSVAKYIESDEYVIGGRNNHRLDVKQGCVYVEALNAENALKRLRQGRTIQV